MAPLALSLGDPAGIGPELIARAWTLRQSQSLPPFFVYGGAGVLQSAARTAGMDLPVARISEPAETASVFAEALPVLSDKDGQFTPRSPDLEGGKLALESLRQATDLVITGGASGLVTAPVAKAQLKLAGFDHPGQTEFLAHACGMGPDEVVMMLAGPTLRTVPLTIHCALADVPQLLSSEMIVQKARITAAALNRDFGLPSPRIALAGLNPHAGEGGQFGDEEARIIAPAIEELRTMGLNITGPHPADALFTPRSRASFDVALCMYHDQALIPIKALEVDEGVNVTLGLPIIRTSPDHGTAFDIAGQGIADPGAMIAAIRMAGECAARQAAA